MQYNQKKRICCGGGKNNRNVALVKMNEYSRDSRDMMVVEVKEYDRNVVELEVNDCNRNVIVEVVERQEVDENEEKGSNLIVG